MAVLAEKQVLKPYIKKAAGYIKSLLSAQHVEMNNGITLQSAVDEIHNNLYETKKKMSVLSIDTQTTITHPTAWGITIVPFREETINTDTSLFTFDTALHGIVINKNAAIKINGYFFSLDNGLYTMPTINGSYARTYASGVNDTYLGGYTATFEVYAKVSKNDKIHLGFGKKQSITTSIYGQLCVELIEAL